MKWSKNWCFQIVVLEKTLESPLDCKEIKAIYSGRKSTLNIHCKDQCWRWSSNSLATWCKELTHLKRPSCWEILRVGEGDDRGWDGWMASLNQRTWIWVSSGNWQWTGKPGVLQSLGWQRVIHDWATELKVWIIYRTHFWWPSGKESTCQHKRRRRHRFDPWVRKIPWTRKRQPSLVLLPGRSHEQRSLEGYSPWGHKRVRQGLATKYHTV